MTEYTISEAKAAYLNGEHVMNIAWRLGMSVAQVRALAVDWQAPISGIEAITQPEVKHVSASVKDIKKAALVNEKKRAKEAAKDKKRAIQERKATRATNTAAHKVTHAKKIEARANTLVVKQAIAVHPQASSEVLSDHVLQVIDEVSLPNELITAAAHAQVRIGYRKLADTTLAIAGGYLSRIYEANKDPEAPMQVEAVKKLAETLKIAIGLSMQAYGMADNSNGAADTPTEPTMSDNEIARRVAFVMARAQAIDVTPTEVINDVK